jgi:ribonuclease HII
MGASQQQDLFAGKLDGGSIGDVERRASSSGHSILIGADEAGRGPLAGPVVAAAVCLPPAIDIPGLNDSKQLSYAQREILFPRILLAARCWAAAFVMPEEIDRINILEASRKAMLKALELAEKRGKLSADLWLIDGNQPLHTTRRQRTIIKGDALSLNIAAASILAKVLRDRWMVLISKRYSGYGFEAHKGYGTQLHLKALDQLGPCGIHRKSFSPVASRLKRTADR